jgi:hypothetical protein
MTPPPEYLEPPAYDGPSAESQYRDTRGEGHESDAEDDELFSSSGDGEDHVSMFDEGLAARLHRMAMEVQNGGPSFDRRFDGTDSVGTSSGRSSGRS